MHRSIPENRVGVLGVPDSSRRCSIRRRRPNSSKIWAVVDIPDVQRKTSKNGTEQSRGLAAALLSALRIWESQDYEKTEELTKRTVKTAAEVRKF